MALHKQVDEDASDAELEINPLYFREESCEIPRYRLPEHGVLPRTALQVVRDELILDGNARLNLATFVTTWMEPEAEPLMAECSPKNMIDKDEYPQTAELEKRCVNILGSLWNAPAGSEAVGCSTTGSSEACMLGGMALLWRWRARRKAAGSPRPAEPGDGRQRPGVLGEVLPLLGRRAAERADGAGRLHLGAAEAAAQCDENTIGVVAIMGSTMDGSYEPVAEINPRWTSCRPAGPGRADPRGRRVRRVRRAVPAAGPRVGLPGAAGGVDQQLRAQVRAGLPGRRLDRVAGRAALPEDLIFKVNYLGGEMPTFALNFSRPGAQVAAQYYNFLRLGSRATGTCSRPARTSRMHLSAEIAKIGPFELLTDGSDLPVFAFKLRDDVTGYSVFDLSERLRMRGWQVPAYTFPGEPDRHRRHADRGPQRLQHGPGEPAPRRPAAAPAGAGAPPANPAAAGDPGQAAVVQALSATW